MKNLQSGGVLYSGIQVYSAIGAGSGGVSGAGSATGAPAIGDLAAPGTSGDGSWGVSDFPRTSGVSIGSKSFGI